MLDVSKLLVETMKRQFPNKEAYLVVLRELKTKLTVLAKTEKVTVETQYKFLKKMEKEREDSKFMYVSQNRFDLANKEREELSAIKQLLTEVEKEMPKQLSEDETKDFILITWENIKKQVDKPNQGMLMRELKSNPNINMALAAKLVKELNI